MLAPLLLGAALGAASASPAAADPAHFALPPQLAADLARRRAAGQGPALAPAWSADAEQIYPAGTGQSAGTGGFWYDHDGQRWRSSICSMNQMFHVAGDEICMDSLVRKVDGQAFGMNNTVGKGTGAVCKIFPAPYYDQFGILAVAKHTGSGEVEGVPCELWEAAIQYQGKNLTASACVAADGVPREFNQTTGFSVGGLNTQQLRFSKVVVGPVSSDAFEPSEVCRTKYPMPPCSDSSVQEFPVYRVHSGKEPASLSNRNVGDALGDMAFFCAIAGFDESQLVTKWTVSASTSWGQYAYCLYSAGKNVCYGHTGNHVGRESALGLGDGGNQSQGQCTPNEDVGSWFSFPDDGECPAGSPVGTGGCTWSAQPVRTVVAACILHDRGLKEACAQERGHAPMTRSSAIFHAALESADPSQGGCPDAPVMREALVVV